MTKIINLGNVRKEKHRMKKEKSAVENRIKFGRTKIEKRSDKRQQDAAKKHIDDHELDNQAVAKFSPQKRSITIAGHRTSLSLEIEFWNELKNIASAGNCSLAILIEKVDAQRKSANLSSALRVYVLQHLKQQSRI